jgi:ribosome-associated protein
MSTKPALNTAVKKDTQKLQRAIVDGLEDVKAQDIVVFDTEHLSALFERVIVASGTSNRQTKALAASVRDSVKAAGFAQPRTEGESNGEWIIVDCGQAVVHIMQPNFRQYYHLEELWGEKPVRLKLGASKPAVAAKVPVKAAAVPAKNADSLRRSSAAKKGLMENFPSKAQVKRAEEKAAGKPGAKTVARKTPAKAASAVPAKTPVKTPAKAPAKKAVAKSTGAKRIVVGKLPAKKVAAKKAAVKR